MKLNFSLLFVIVLINFILSGCGSSSPLVTSPTLAPQPSTVPSATPLSPTDVPPPTHTPTVQDLLGIWVWKRQLTGGITESWTLGFNEDGTYAFSLSLDRYRNSDFDEIGTYQLKDSLLILLDTGGLNGCAPNQVGLYNVRITSTRYLYLNVIEDPCDWRREDTATAVFHWLSLRP